MSASGMMDNVSIRGTLILVLSSFADVEPKR